MQEVIDFVTAEWLLVGTLAVLIAALVLSELQKRTPSLASGGVARLINQHQALIFDLRATAEYDAGHIAGSQQLAPSDALPTLKKMKVGQDKHLLLVCGNGQASRTLGNSLRKSGYGKVQLLSGGINSWRLDNMPLVQDGGAAKKALPGKKKTARKPGKGRKKQQS